MKEITLEKSYSIHIKKYYNFLQKDKFLPCPDRNQLAAAIDTLHLDFLILANHFPWHPIMSDTHMYFCIPEEREAFMMWDGTDIKLFIYMASRLLVQMRLGFERDKSILSCNHKKCLLSKEISNFEYFLCPEHIKIIDKNFDGKITIEEIDVNRDGILRLGLGFSEKIFPKSSEIICNMENVLLKLFPNIDKKNLNILPLNFSQISKTAGRSWHWYD
jgi:hypothetical protein